jgi:N-acetyl-gamma-glutamyl-phosphate reductase
MEVAPYFLKAKKKVVDLSADYRLRDEHLYAKWYGVEHKDVQNISRSVYGLPEIYRDEIKGANFIANPGCYPTSVILGAAPLFKEGIAEPELIADSKSGVSGAGRSLSMALLYAEVNESVKAYKVDQHQHQPEMEQEITLLNGKQVRVIFTPHLIPMTRGILSTLYIRLKGAASDNKIRELYKSFYAGSPFVRILPEGEFPQTKQVSHTNYCDINFKVAEGTNLVIVTSAIDNLVKGASGQAVQNMNLMSGWDETTGLM